MRKSFFTPKASITWIALFLVSVFLVACGSETNNPLHSDATEEDTTLASPAFWSNPGTVDGETAPSFGPLMHGAYGTVEDIEETTVQGMITEVFPGGNFILETQIETGTEDILVMIHRHHGQIQQMLAHRSGMMGGGMMGRPHRNAQSTQPTMINAEPLAGVEAGVAVTVTGFLMPYQMPEELWPHEDVEMPVSRLMAMLVTDTAGTVIYQLDEEDIHFAAHHHGM